jgi:hypothetical protein
VDRALFTVIDGYDVLKMTRRLLLMYGIAVKRHGEKIRLTV